MAAVLHCLSSLTLVQLQDNNGSTADDTVVIVERVTKKESLKPIKEGVTFIEQLCISGCFSVLHLLFFTTF